MPVSAAKWMPGTIPDAHLSSIFMLIASAQYWVRRRSSKPDTNLLPSFSPVFSYSSSSFLSPTKSSLTRFNFLLKAGLFQFFSVAILALASAIFR